MSEREQQPEQRGNQIPPLRIFLSYAWKDNQHPPDDPDAKGFVTALNEQLIFELNGLGPPTPEIWWDIDNVKDGDLFDPKIKDAVDKSALFVAVLSRNWVDRTYCRNELEMFKQRWQVEDEFKLEHRVVVVHRNLVDPGNTPALLTGQRGFRFFKFNGPEEAGSERLFYDRGEIQNDEYKPQVRNLAGYLWRKAKFIRDKVDPPPPPVVDPPFNPPPRNGRIIYLAKPGRDLDRAYERVAKELIGKGYEIRPGKNDGIPQNSLGVGFIDKALAASELSVHLVGSDLGTAAAGDESIVKLQLERAAERVAGTATNTDSRRFRRVIWVPKVLDQKIGEDSAALARDVSERNPVNVLETIDRCLPTDKIDGSGLTDFVIFLLQNLDAVAPVEDEARPTPGNAGYYVYHRDEDRSLAIGVAKALKKLDIEPILPALRGEELGRTALHLENLRECDNVVLCWGIASELWAKTSSRELKDWKKLGRSKKFALRGLVVGPPPDEVKTDVADLWPRSEIDVVINLPSQDPPSPETLAPLDPGQ